MNEIPVQIAVSEPWELGEAINWHERLGTLVRVENQEGSQIGLVSLTADLPYENRKWSYLLARPRSDRMNLSALDSGASVPCNFIGLVEEPVGKALFEVLDEWRGGLAFVGDLSHANK